MNRDDSKKNSDIKANLFNSKLAFDNADEVSEANISEISFPSHVSGLESFSDFEKTLNSSVYDGELHRKAPTASHPAQDKTESLIAASNQDMSNGIFNLTSPTAVSEQLVADFLGYESQESLAVTVKPTKAAAQSEYVTHFSQEKNDGNTIDDGLSTFQDIQDIELEPVNGVPSARNNIAMDSQQRPGLDGSSSDSDDGAAINFARSRIATTHRLTAFADDQRQQFTNNISEERQLAEGDDVFSRDVPGDGGGGGDGSSGHSDSDGDGDGGVSIRVRNRRQQRMAATATVSPLSQHAQAGENLPERERPIGDSVPASDSQWRAQLMNNNEDNGNSDNNNDNGTTRHENVNSLDLDSSQDSRLSARFLMASSTPGPGVRNFPPQRSNWMEENSTFRLSESAPATPNNGEDAHNGNSLDVDQSDVNNSGNVRRDVLGDDNEEDTTIIGDSNGFAKSDEPTSDSHADTDTESVLSTPQPLKHSISNPFRLSAHSSNPFTAETFCKNPFDDMTAAVDASHAFIFSGFEEKNDPTFGDSEFKVNSQDAEALFDDDEKSFEHSNTVSKLASLSQGSEWTLNEIRENAEVRLSKYFQAFSEELGNFSLDASDKPRPNFDDFKIVKTPPALQHPAILYRGLHDDEDVHLHDGSDKLEESSGNNTLIDDNTNQDQPPDEPENSRSVRDALDANTPDFDTQTEADRDNYGIRGDGHKIDLPTTNGEAESLLHDIEVGRVSLRGISGVNMSNLAAKIAVATNSDPQFILKLLITLIESEKAHEKTDKGKQAFTSAALKAESKEIKNQELAKANLASSTKFPASSSGSVSGVYSLAPHVASIANSQDHGPMTLSDLNKTPLSASVAVNASSCQSHYSMISSDYGYRISAKDSYTQQTDTKLVCSATVRPSANYIVHSASQKGLCTTTSTTSIATIRPMSLIPSSETRTLYRDSSVQCYAGTAEKRERKQPERANPSYGRNYDDKEVRQADAAVQYELPYPGEDKLAETDMAGLLPQTIMPLTETGATNAADSGLPAINKRQFKDLNKHLSSTAIYGDESSASYPASNIALSPVGYEADSPFGHHDDDAWRPLGTKHKSIQPMRTLTDELPRSSSGRPESADKNKHELKLSGKEIHDILPRISDIRPRESYATFYPVMTANQTVLHNQSPTTPSSRSSQDQLHFKPVRDDSHMKGSTQSDKQNIGAANKLPIARSIQIVVPNDITFADVQCVGVAVNRCLPIHNPSSRWIQCLTEISFYSVNGAQAETFSVCAFSMQPKVFIAPHTTEDVKVTFYADHAGVFMAKLNVIASSVVTDDSVLDDNELSPYVIHLEAVAELPNVEIIQEKGESLDFGEISEGITRAKDLKLVNRGRADVPLKIVLSANTSIWKYFSFAKTDGSSENSAFQNKIQDSSENILPPSLCIILPGGHLMGKTSKPEVVSVQFKAPVTIEANVQSKLGPAKEFTARVDIEVDSKGQSIIIGSVLLKAVVGIARLHAPRSLQAVSLSTTENQRISRGIPFRNAGNISLQIQLQITTFTDMFSVIPENVVLAPGESTDVFIHFQSSSLVTVESFLLVTVIPDGPQYEVVLRGTATKRLQIEEKPVLLCNKPVLCWAGVAIGRSMQQRAYLRNNHLTQNLKMTISVEGNHSDFQIQNTFDFKEKNSNTFEVDLMPQSEIPVHVLFIPSTLAMISSAIVIRPAIGGPKFRIPLYGYGGCSKLSLTNAQRIGENYWIDSGEMSLGKQNIIKLSLQNVGNRPAFVKVVCYADISKRKLYPSTHISVAPNDFVLLEKCVKELVVVLQPTESVLLNSKDKPCTAACLAVFSGDECVRQLYRRCNSKSNQRKVEREGPLQNLIFDADFIDDDKITDDINDPQVPNWEHFFVSSVSRTVLSLIARPASDDASISTLQRSPALNPQDLMITETPARRLPTSDKGDMAHDNVISDTNNLAKNTADEERWTVSPEHVVLTAPNTVSDKSTARIQMINFSEKPLSFEFIWPAQSLIVTPSKDNVPPRSQLIVFVSTKPSFLTTGGEVPWKGCIYVQCEGIQKCIRVQIREDLALDSSPITDFGRRLAPLNPSNATQTPLREKTAPKPNSLLTVEPKSVTFPVTFMNGFSESVVSIQNNSAASLKWVLSSIAPPYFKDIGESEDIFRTTYTAFRFMKYSGSVHANGRHEMKVTFQPRDIGEYSQFWDIQFAVEATGQTGKYRIELRGKGTSGNDGAEKEAKKVGRAQPILKPSAFSKIDQQKKIEINDESPEDKPSHAKPSAKQNRGVFVKDEILTFNPTLRGETSEVQFRLCNDTMEMQKVRLSGLKSPFAIKHTKLAIKSKSFIRIPVFYTPHETGLTSEGKLEVTTVTGQARSSYVKFIGVCASKR